ncbi:MAG: twin-arginine translocase subunit TatC [Muribaculaceae bacterium]|nr:twin-arginine translocase subunit TatC [Muribaculaceae bacterium]
MPQNSEMSFWDHLDQLRGVLIKAGAVILVFAVAMFIAMPWLFDHVILAPCESSFPLYHLFDSFSSAESTSSRSAWMPTLSGEGFHVSLINIELASQFFIHMSLSCWLGLVLAFPIVIYIFWTFIRPGLYPSERRNATRAFALGNVMFYLGVATGYFLVFPMTLRFLADYQLSESVPNTISLSSYIDNFLMIILLMGAVFELPLLAWVLGRMGLIDRRFFATYRRHAIVALLIAAAIITPTGDPFTLLLVFLPIYLLWEASRLLVPPSPDKKAAEADDASE